MKEWRRLEIFAGGIEEKRFSRMSMCSRDCELGSIRGGSGNQAVRY